MKVHERFINYAKIYTTSDENSETCPSTERQLVLAKLLVKELEEIGLDDVKMDKNGYVTGKLYSNTEKKVPSIGFIAHMDTATDITGENVKPVIIENYNGKDIPLNSEYTMKTSDFPELLNYVGNDIIVTDGTTLLGADDKAGIAEIITAVAYLKKHPEIEHGTICVGFTPDEEIGRGADLFDVEDFAADFAYTLDGGEIGELEYENFNAATLEVQITGRNVHPGSAKDKLINALELGIHFHNSLPSFERPEYTEKYEGFYHLIEMNGTTENSTLKYIIRDHDKIKFEHKKSEAARIAGYINKLYNGNWINVKVTDSYYNMKEKIEPVMYIVDLAEKSMKDAGVKPLIQAIRGGTDGGKLSYMGLPCPNIFTGGHNFHSRFEYISVQSMEKAVDVILKIVENSLDL